MNIGGWGIGLIGQISLISWSNVEHWALNIGRWMGYMGLMGWMGYDVGFCF